MSDLTPQDNYVNAIVAARAPRSLRAGSLDPVATIARAWANNYLLELKMSGSYAKGTAVAGSADADIFISLDQSVYCGNTPTLETLYKSLAAYFRNHQYSVKLQNVSIGIEHAGIHVDLVPAVKHPGNTNDHSLYRRKNSTWTKTNVDKHIDHVKKSGRTTEIRAVKIWRNLHGLDISSFYLELVVLEALKGKALIAPASNFMAVMDYLKTTFVLATITDPANTANKISDELSIAERQFIANQAKASRSQPNWGTIIW